MRYFLFLSGEGLSVNKISRRHQPDNIFRISSVILSEVLVLTRRKADLHLLFDIYLFRLLVTDYITPFGTNGYDVLGGILRMSIFYKKFGKMQTF